MKRIVGGEDSEAILHRMATAYFDDPIEEFIHSGKCICFTGKFISGARREVEAKAKSLGASTHPNISSKVNAVIIGSLASRDWRFSNHGRKIEKALKLQSEGHEMIIISEKVWIEHT